MLPLAFKFLLALLPSVALAGLFSSKGDVRVLDVKGLGRHLRSTDKLTVVAFYAPWCGYCKQLQPQWDKAATNLKNLVNLVAVDCDDDANKAACHTDYGVKGFPTIKYFSGNPQPKDYQGERTAKAIVDFSLSQMPTFARKVKSEADLDSLISKATPEKPLSVLFTKQKLTAPMYKALSSEFHKGASIYTAHESVVGSSVSKYGASVPGLVVFTGPGTGDVHLYDGPLKYDGLSGFLKKFTGGKEKTQAGSSGAKKAAGEL